MSWLTRLTSKSGSTEKVLKPMKQTNGLSKSHDWKLWIGMFISSLFLYLAFRKIDLSRMWAVVKSANLYFLALIAIFHAEDGYTSSLPLSVIREYELLLAHKMNGVTLPPERGFPFQVVAESRWGYKWVKWVTKIELSDDAEYRGYWEKKGYNNDADVAGPILEERSR